MNTTERNLYQEKVSLVSRSRVSAELAVGFLRYEALRKLNARQYAELCKRNLNGENFDAMVDELVKGII